MSLWPTGRAGAPGGNGSPIFPLAPACQAIRSLITIPFSLRSYIARTVALLRALLFSTHAREKQLSGHGPAAEGAAGMDRGSVD